MTDEDHLSEQIKVNIKSEEFNRTKFQINVIRWIYFFLAILLFFIVLAFFQNLLCMNTEPNKTFLECINKFELIKERYGDSE